MNGIQITIAIIIIVFFMKLIIKPSKRKKIRKKTKVMKKGGWNDEELISRLTNHELKLKPNISKQEARKTAMERLKRDMR